MSVETGGYDPTETLTPKILGVEKFNYGDDEDDEEDEEDGLDFATPETQIEKVAEIAEKKLEKPTIKQPERPTETEIAMKELLFSQKGEQVQTMYNPELPANARRKDELKKLLEGYEDPPLSNLEKEKMLQMGKEFDKTRESFYSKHSEDDLANYASNANQNEIQFLIERNPESVKVLSASLAGKGTKARKALKIISRMPQTEGSKLSPEFKKDLVDLKLESSPELINALSAEEQTQRVFENPNLLPHLSRDAKKQAIETAPPEKFTEVLNNLDVNNLDLLTETESFEQKPQIIQRLIELSIQGPDFFLNLPDDKQEKILKKMDDTSREQFFKIIDKYTSRSDVQMSSRFIGKKLRGMVS